MPHLSKQTQLCHPSFQVSRRVRDTMNKAKDLDLDEIQKGKTGVGQTSEQESEDMAR